MTYALSRAAGSSLSVELLAGTDRPGADGDGHLGALLWGARLARAVHGAVRGSVAAARERPASEEPAGRP